MNAPEQRAVRREKVLHGLFWGGMGLAPIAVLVLLFGQSTGSLRVAVTLSVLTIVMLAVSVAMRPSVEMLRVDIEHRVLDELERVRARSRDDITTAARNTHRALTEKIQSVADRFEDVRAQLGEMQAQIEDVRTNGAIAQAAEISGYGGGPPGVVRRTETVHVTRRTTTVDAGDDAQGGTVYGSKAAVDGEWRERRDPEDRDGAHGDRNQWAAVRADDHASELRVGERRVRRDGRGGEEVEDRWAALRRDAGDASSDYLDRKSVV